MNTNVKLYSKIALVYLFIAAFLGIVLRLFPVTNIDATHRYIVHTHSHIALLGWVYIALTTLIYFIGIDKKKQQKNNLIFWSTQATIIGMLFSFPFIGYALYSIIFSTFFMICSYWFYAFFRKHHHFKTDNISYKFINTSLLLMVISTIGPWALGIIVNTLGATSPWYKNAIYFYLHFQYNGWFLFCLIGVFYYILEKNKIAFSKQKATLFFKLIIISCVLTLFLSFLWTKPSVFVFGIAFIGAVLQLFAFRIFYQQLHKIKSTIKTVLSPNLYKLLVVAFGLFLMKIILQMLTGIPYFSKLATNILDFVIGYLHLIFLGIVTITTLVFLTYFKLITLPKNWTQVYILGFILSEILIFYKGFSMWQQTYLIDNYFTILVLCSALMPIGILGILIRTITNYSTQPKSL